MNTTAFVESSEYRKELAREIARRILAAIDVRELLNDPAGYSADMLEALVRKLKADILADAVRDARAHSATALGLAPLTAAELDRLVTARVKTVVEEAQLQLDTRASEASRQINRTLDAGASVNAVLKSLEGQGGRSALLAGLLGILSQTGAGLVGETERAIIEGAGAKVVDIADYRNEPPPLFEWETRQDDRVCEDVFENSCIERHGRALTWDEWGAFGRPGSENLICSIYAKGAFSNCRCVLRDAGMAEGRSASPLSITTAIEAGRLRARAVFEEAA